jgi:hypothetical protein
MTRVEITKVLVDAAASGCVEITTEIELAECVTDVGVAPTLTDAAVEGQGAEIVSRPYRSEQNDDDKEAFCV